MLWQHLGKPCDQQIVGTSGFAPLSSVVCSAGIGRTGLFTASLAKRYLGLSGAEALQWGRRFIPRAVETPEQQQLVLDDDGS